MVVSRRKRSSYIPKDPLKNNIVANLSNSFDKLSTSTKKVGHVGNKGKGQATIAPAYTSNAASPYDSKNLKSDWKVKKRRHDEGTS